MATLQHFSTAILFSSRHFSTTSKLLQRFSFRARTQRCGKKCQQVSKSVFSRREKKESVLPTYTVHSCELKALRYSATKSHEWSFAGSYVRGEGNQTPCLPFCTWLGVNRVRTTGFIQEEAWPHNTDDVPFLRHLEWKISLSGYSLLKMSGNSKTQLIKPSVNANDMRFELNCMWEYCANRLLSKVHCSHLSLISLPDLWWWCGFVQTSSSLPLLLWLGSKRLLIFQSVKQNSLRVNFSTISRWTEHIRRRYTSCLLSEGIKEKKRLAEILLINWHLYPSDPFYVGALD